jgi:hypothetical protein
MNRILFLSFFGFRDYILDIKNEFTDQGFIVESVPYIELKQDKKMTDDQIILEMETIINKNPDDPIKYIMMYILPSNENFIKNLKNTCKINGHELFVIFYNFDDPYSINSDLLKYSHGIDLFITPLAQSVDKLKILLDSDTRICNIPMYIANIPILGDLQDIKKLTDIIFLYDTSREHIYDMKKIIVDLKHMCMDHNISIKMYGSPELEYVYPDIYADIYNKENLQSVVSDAKIIIFMNNNFNKSAPIDPIIYDCMKYGCILMIPYDRKKIIFAKDQISYLMYDNKYLETIFNCVKKYDKYKSIGKNAYDMISTKYSLQVWTQQIKALLV